MFFKTFKSYFAKEVLIWFINNNRRYHISQMIGIAWHKSAFPAIDILAFKTTGINPYIPNAISEYFFETPDALIFRRRIVLIRRQLLICTK